MRLLSLLTVVLAVPAGPAAQVLGQKVPAVQHVTVSTALSAASASAGQTVTLWADVLPKPGIHVYAAGAKEFTPVALTIYQHADFKPGAVKYPSADRPASLKAADLDVPAYYAKFRIAQPIAIAAGAAGPRTLTVNGEVSYQACDDRLCYPVASAPVSWTIALK